MVKLTDVGLCICREGHICGARMTWIDNPKMMCDFCLENHQKGVWKI